MRVDWIDVLFMVGLVAVIAGLAMIGPIYGLIGGGALVMVTSLILARAKSGATGKRDNAG